MHAYLYLTSLLIVRNCLVYTEGVNSSAKVRDNHSNVVGPRIELSATVLKEGERLSYTCRQDNGRIENGLQRFTSGEHFVEITPSTRQPPQACQADDRFLQCTINAGTVIWRKELAGNYSCQAYPEHNYYIHWINATNSFRWNASSVKDISWDVVGSEVKLRCSLDIAPANIPYQGILTPRWTFSKDYDGNATGELPFGVSLAVEGQGPIVVATITNFNLSVHAGRYHCNGQVLRYSGPIEPAVIDVKVKPQAQLTNNKNDQFEFDEQKIVNFICAGWAAPSPTSVTVSIDSTAVEGVTDGISDYAESTPREINGLKKFLVQFRVSNLAVVFKNGSNLSCQVVRGMEIAETSQQIILFKQKIFTIREILTTRRVPTTTLQDTTTSQQSTETVTNIFVKLVPELGRSFGIIVVGVSVTTAIIITIIIVAIIMCKRKKDA